MGWEAGEEEKRVERQEEVVATQRETARGTQKDSETHCGTQRVNCACTHTKRSLERQKRGQNEGERDKGTEREAERN